MCNDLSCKINIQIRPIKVARSWLFNVEHLTHGNILEPREVLIGHEQLLLTG
jgi:hypothetical protein